MNLAEEAHDVRERLGEEIEVLEETEDGGVRDDRHGEEQAPAERVRRSLHGPRDGEVDAGGAEKEKEEAPVPVAVEEQARDEQELVLRAAAPPQEQVGRV